MSSPSELKHILEKLGALDERLARIEDSLAQSIERGRQREAALREEVGRKQREIEELGGQGLHVVAQLDAALRRIRELEARTRDSS